MERYELWEGNYLYLKQVCKQHRHNNRRNSQHSMVILISRCSLPHHAYGDVRGLVQHCRLHSFLSCTIAWQQGLA